MTTTELPRCPTTGKYAYGSENEALRALHRVRRARAGKGSRERSLYRCFACHLWHLTSLRQK